MAGSVSGSLTFIAMMRLLSRGIAELTVEAQSSQQDCWWTAARERYLPPSEAANIQSIQESGA